MLVICPFPYGVAAGQRLKFEQYYEDWRASGWQVDVAPFMDMALWDVLYVRGHYLAKVWGVAKGYLRRLGDLFRVPNYDLVYCHMYVTPLGGSGFERAVRLLAAKLLYDVEDNVLDDLNRVGSDHPNPLLRLLRRGSKYAYLVREADHVVTASPLLNERYRAINRHGASTSITSSMDSNRVKPPEGHANTGLVTLGWTGTFSSRVYLDLIGHVLQQLARERRFKLRVISNFDYELPGVEVEVIRWTTEAEATDLQGIDIGLYPLKEDEWSVGKSGIKAIQYMMVGRPCVASNVSTTPQVVRHGQTGLLVNSDEEWLDALRRLIDDAELRQQLGEQGRQDAVAHFSVQAVAGQYRKVLSSVVEAR